MCLIDKVPVRYAEEDIEVYKVVTYKDHKYLGIFTNMEYDIASKVIKPETEDEPIKIKDGFKFEAGFIHAINRDIWVKPHSITETDCEGDNDCKILKCVIPKGTRYAIDRRWNTCCARELKIVGFICWNK